MAIALISQVSKVMLKIIKARLQRCVNRKLPDAQTVFIKGRGTRIKLPAFTASQIKQENSRKKH